MDNKNLIYLDTYVLQKDMRIRLPKSILENLNVEKGKTRFQIFLNQSDSSLVLRLDESHLDNVPK